MAKSEVSADEAKRRILDGYTGTLTVRGCVDLRAAKIETIKAKLSCHDLDASRSSLKRLPRTLRVQSRLVMDRCSQLEALPKNLECGSISLQDCGFLSALPEGLKTWFLDLSGCSRFSKWPKDATIHRGIVRLRNCIEIQQLPNWFGQLGQLDLSGCVQICDLPEGLQISSWIDVGGTSVTKLPKSLENAPLRWRGVPVNARIAFEPESLTATEILEEQNAELRRVMMDRMGYLRFAQEAGAKRLDKDTDAGGQRELLKINLNDDEPLVGLSCFCPSTGRQYFLRVPPSVKSCHEAAAWMAGFDDPGKYKPSIET